MKNLKLYLALLKPRILVMQLVTVSLGYFLALSGQPAKWGLFGLLLLGTGLVSGGAGCLNHYLERVTDGLMDRTKNRPIPSGKIRSDYALILGGLCSVVGLVVLFNGVAKLTAFLSFITLILYLLVYTPLKRLTWLNTFVGAIPGAIPPLGGWAAATQSLAPEAWIFFLILFAWQHPHFYAIAWMFKSDYQKAGFQMLPTIDATGSRTIRQVILYCLLLIFFSVLPYQMGMLGFIYLAGALVLGGGYLVSGVRLGVHRTPKMARGLLRASVIYLPLLLILIMIDLGLR